MLPLLLAAFAGHAAATSSSMDTMQTSVTSVGGVSSQSGMSSISGTPSMSNTPGISGTTTLSGNPSLSGTPSHTDATSSIQFSDTVISGTPTPTGMDACAAHCHVQWEACNATPGANMAQCMADYVACVGYNFGNGNFPKTCASSSRTSSQTPVITGDFKDKCARNCVTLYDQCIQAPEPNLAFCHRKLVDCVGYNPFTQPGGYTQPTACRHPGGGVNITVTGVNTITTTYCPPGQSQTTTATIVVFTSTAGSGGPPPPGSSGPSNTQASPTPSIVAASAYRFQPGFVVLFVVGLALL